MKCRVNFLILFVLYLVSLTVASPVIGERPQKRDLFVSTGWGGAGLPHSSFYITGKQVKEMRNENKKRHTIDEQQNELPKSSDWDDVPKGTGTVPQLFSSNGWGPLGR